MWSSLKSLAAKLRESWEFLKGEIAKHKYSEASITESQITLQRIIDSMPFGVMTIDKNKRILTANKTALDLTGYESIEELTGRICHDMMCPAERGKCPMLDLKQDIDKSERFIVHKSGKQTLVLKSVIPVTIEQEEVLLETFMDITDLKEAQKKIQRSSQEQMVLNNLLSFSLEEADIQEFLQNSLNVIMTVPWLELESKGGIFLVKDGSNILTMKVQQGLSEQIRTICSEVPFGRCLCGRAATTGQIQFSDCIDDRHENRYEGISPHGHYCMPIKSAGKVLGVINLYLAEHHKHKAEDESFLQSIADVLAGVIIHKRTQQTLKSEQAFSHSLVETAQAIMLVLDTEGRIVEFNPYMEKICGWGINEVKGRDWFETFLPERNRGQIRKLFKKAIIGIQTCGNINPILTKDGHEIQIEWYDKTLKDDAGNISGLLSIGQEVTERIKIEEKKEQLEAQLFQMQKMEAIGTLAGGIAHDFNNILAALMGYIELSLDDLPEGTLLHDNMEQSMICCHRAKDMVRQILTFSRKTDFKPKPMEVAPVVIEALKMLRSSIPTTIEIAENIEFNSGVIMADPTQIHQILVNLCTNASHAIGDNAGLIKIGLTAVDVESPVVTNFGTLLPGPYVKLTVADTGCGMKKEILKRIYEPFFTTKDIGKGTGLGLSVVHGIIESYKGLITVESTPGEGTTFSVFFPRIESSGLRQFKSVETASGGEESILLVDDEKFIISMMTQMLQRLGYTVEGFTSPNEALEVFQTNPGRFDLVITDYVMPNMTGKELAEEIMNIRSDIPVILCTGFSENINAEKARMAGIKEFVMKPVTKDKIAVIIRRVLDKKETSV